MAAAADVGVPIIEPQAEPLPDGVERLDGLGHDFRPDAVAGQDGDRLRFGPAIGMRELVSRIVGFPKLEPKSVRSSIVKMRQNGAMWASYDYIESDFIPTIMPC